MSQHIDRSTATQAQNAAVPVGEATSRDLIQSLASETCPACGMGKKPRMTLCGPCYHKLPSAQRLALYRRIGEGYEAAVTSAFGRLGRTEFRLPGALP